MFLVTVSGMQLRILDQEIKKLITYKGTDITITKDDIEAVASGGEQSALTLVDLLRKRDIPKALVLLRQLSNDEEPIVLLGLLAAQFRLFLQVRQAMDSGQPMEQLGPALGKHPFYLKKIGDDLRGFSAKKLKELFYMLQRFDLAIKTGELDPWLALEEFILAI